MQKTIAVFAAIIMTLTVLVVPVSADGLEAQFIDYIAETYELQADKIILEGIREQTLEHMGRNLVVGYFFTDEEEYIKGQVALDQSSGQFLSEQELSDLLSQEWEYTIAENERLQAEAGKMGVWFYQELLTRDAKEKISLLIIPRFELSPDLESRIKALYEEYDMEVPRDLDPQEGYIVYPEMPGSVDGFDGEGRSEPGSPGTDDVIDPEPATDSIDFDIPDAVDGDEPVSSDDEARPLPRPEPDPYYEEFYVKLAELYAEGYQPALERLAAYLGAKGIEYEVQYGTIVAELTVAQALAMRNHSDIQWLGSMTEDDFHILPAFLRTGQERNDLAADADGSGTAENKGRYWLWGTLMAAVVAAVVWVVKR